MDSSKVLRCRLSDPSQPHYLSDSRYGSPPSDCFTCGQRKSDYVISYYYCEACNVHFHDLCHEFPRKIRHPYHLQHLLTFTFFNKSKTLISDGHILDYDNEDNESNSVSDETDLPSPTRSHDKCDWCGKDVKPDHLSLGGPVFYRCSICGFTLDDHCSRLDVALTIVNQRSHEHTLTLLPRPLLTPCDACGLVDPRDPAYTCLPCNYVVHWTCVGLPHIIKIPYHQHRLSHMPYLPQGKWSCGVCYRNIDVKYGAYSCIQGCSTIFHSKCATNNEIWDGEELEWEPEGPKENKDIEPFQRISEEEILHFSHEHHLQFNEVGSVRDTYEQCQACVFRVDSGNFYSCMKCNFFLHATCASLPRKKETVLHRHPLILDPLPLWNINSIDCSACWRKSCGFRYSCKECNFQLDVRCASMSNSFKHRSHQHPLFICRSDSISDKQSCQRCLPKSSSYYAKCIYGCNFILCFECATYPDEVRYKYDEHLLGLNCGEDVSDLYWCEVCEEELNPKEWFYACEACSVTLHITCAFGSSVYMKHGHNLKYGDLEVEVVRNSSSSRPICSVCGKRCQDHVFYKEMDNCFCSLLCAKFSCSRWCALPRQLILRLLR